MSENDTRVYFGARSDCSFLARINADVRKTDKNLRQSHRNVKSALCEICRRQKEMKKVYAWPSSRKTDGTNV